MEKTYKFGNENKWRKALEYLDSQTARYFAYGHSRITVFGEEADKLLRGYLNVHKSAYTVVDY